MQYHMSRQGVFRSTDSNGLFTSANGHLRVQGRYLKTDGGQKTLKKYFSSHGSLWAEADVRSLEVADFLLGTFPIKVFSMHFLRELSLQHCGIPKVPQNIKGLENLTSLRLVRNDVDSLPEEICTLPLRVLDVANNKLTELPRGVADLPMLQRLCVADNHITALPEALGLRQNLEDVDVSFNALTSLPDGIFGLYLRTFFASHNRLCDLPAMVSCVALTDVDVSDNLLTDLPCLGRNVATVEASGNRFHEFPCAVITASMMHVDLARNHIVAIPAVFFEECQKLTSVNLSYNAIVEVPTSLASYRRFVLKSGNSGGVEESSSSSLDLMHLFDSSNDDDDDGPPPATADHAKPCQRAHVPYRKITYPRPVLDLSHNPLVEPLVSFVNAGQYGDVYNYVLEADKVARRLQTEASHALAEMCSAADAVLWRCRLLPGTVEGDSDLNAFFALVATLPSEVAVEIYRHATVRKGVLVDTLSRSAVKLMDRKTLFRMDNPCEHAEFAMRAIAMMACKDHGSGKAREIYLALHSLWTSWKIPFYLDAECRGFLVKVLCAGFSDRWMQTSVLSYLEATLPKAVTEEFQQTNASWYNFRAMKAAAEGGTKAFLGNAKFTRSPGWKTFLDQLMKDVALVHDGFSGLRDEQKIAWLCRGLLRPFEASFLFVDKRTRQLLAEALCLFFKEHEEYVEEQRISQLVDQFKRGKRNVKHLWAPIPFDAAVEKCLSAPPDGGLCSGSCVCHRVLGWPVTFGTPPELPASDL